MHTASICYEGLATACVHWPLCWNAARGEHAMADAMADAMAEAMVGARADERGRVRGRTRGRMRGQT